MAPKSAYKTKVEPRLEEIRLMRGSGATQVQIAKELGVTVNSLYKWILQYPELKEVMDDGRKIQAETLIGKLYEMATGQVKTKTTETVTRISPDGKVSTETHEKITEVPPDKGAALNLLSNLTLWQRDGKLDHWLTDPDAWDARMKELQHKKDMDAW